MCRCFAAKSQIGILSDLNAPPAGRWDLCQVRYPQPHLAAVVFDSGCRKSKWLKVRRQAGAGSPMRNAGMHQGVTIISNGDDCCYSGTLGGTWHQNSKSPILLPNCVQVACVNAQSQPGRPGVSQAFKWYKTTHFPIVLFTPWPGGIFGPAGRRQAGGRA